MSKDYKITTNIPHFNLTRFSGGISKGVCLNITKYVSYYESHGLRLTYKEVLQLKESMINFLRNNKGSEEACYQLEKGFTLETKHVKTLITDLHIYLNDPIHK
ncbi:hypothetical protein VPH184E373B_0134 [Vibrio phage 184E37-3b]|nr:hypothetical protein MYOV056v2_p0116 [Vibrio phage 184E37.3a]